MKQLIVKCNLCCSLVSLTGRGVSFWQPGGWGGDSGVRSPRRRGDFPSTPGEGGDFRELASCYQRKEIMRMRGNINRSYSFNCFHPRRLLPAQVYDPSAAIVSVATEGPAPLIPVINTSLKRIISAKVSDIILTISRIKQSRDRYSF